jgi:hypothetical protein
MAILLLPLSLLRLIFACLESAQPLFESKLIHLEAAKSGFQS